METRDDFVMVGGARHRIRLLDTGGVDRPWLVFLHEGLGSIPQWRGFPAELTAATGLNALLYERRNHGMSDPLPRPRRNDYHAEEAELLDQLLEDLGIPAAITLGHSDGATIALLHAAAHPRRVAAVVSEAGHVAVEQAARRGIEHARERYATGGLREALERHHGSGTEAMFNAWSMTWLDPIFDGWDIRPTLAAVTAPVLAIQGEHDEYATPDHVDWIAAAVSGPVETAILTGAGHAPHRETAPAVIDRIVAFLAAHGLVE